MNKLGKVVVFSILGVIFVIVLGFLLSAPKSSALVQCGWAKLNKQMEYNVKFNWGPTGNITLVSYTEAFLVPQDILYRQAKINKSGMSFTCGYTSLIGTNSPCFIQVNNVTCAVGTTSERREYVEFNETCLAALHSGINAFGLNFYAPGNASIHNLYLEMDVLPASC